MRRRLLIVAGLILALATVNLGIVRYERVLASGRPVLLELAPVDPRSIMQGDYMALRFAVAGEIAQAHREAGLEAAGGLAVLRLDADGIGHFARLASEAAPPGRDELAVRYRLRGGTAFVVTDAWFFEEGRAGHFAAARYGEVRVAPDGTALLAALRDDRLSAL